MRLPALYPIVAVLPLAFAGCHLVDQTSFGAGPRPPAPDQLSAALAAHGAAPLLVIRPDDQVPYDAALRDAVAAAEARDGAAPFRLVAVAPAGGDLPAQQAALDAATAAARAVLDAMGRAGVSPERVSLAARADPAVTRVEIRLYQG